MTRFGVASTVLLVAGLVAAAVAESRVAEARATASPFAGSYSGWVPTGRDVNSTWSITIAKTGGVKASYFADLTEFGFGTASGELQGRVTEEGTVSVSGSEWGRSRGDRYSFDMTGQLTRTAAGDLLGTTSDGTQFTWYAR